MDAPADLVTVFHAEVTLTAAWDGHGMAATRSHALRFVDFPATRIAWPGHVPQLAVEENRDGRRTAVQGKKASAKLAEAATGRLCRVPGGGR